MSRVQRAVVLSVLTIELIFFLFLSSLQLLLPLVILLDRIVPVLLALHIISRLFRCNLLPQVFGEPFLFLESGEFTCSRSQLLVIFDQRFTVVKGGLILKRKMLN